MLGGWRLLIEVGDGTICVVRALMNWEVNGESYLVRMAEEVESGGTVDDSIAAVEV